MKQVNGYFWTCILRATCFLASLLLRKRPMLMMLMKAMLLSPGTVSVFGQRHSKMAFPMIEAATTMLRLENLVFLIWLFGQPGISRYNLEYLGTDLWVRAYVRLSV